MTSQKIPLAGVIGSPIAHSKSPLLHRHWLQRYDIPGFYIPMDVSSADFKQVLDALPKMGFVGANVTIPHKELVMSIADLVTDRATLIGAANTLIFRPDGKIHADNTDGFGFTENLKSHVLDWDPTSGAAALFGAGGAARAVIVALLDAGVPEIRLTNRTRARADKLQADFGNRIKVFDWVQAGNMIEQAKLVVNTSSLGMMGHPEMRVPLDALNSNMIVTDLVYNPLKTKLLEQAEAVGAKAVDGLGMLLYQGVPGFERWFGRRPDVDAAARQAVLA